MKTTNESQLPNYDPIMWFLLILAFMIFYSTKCNSQTYAELRGGGISNIDGGGAISAGFTHELNKLSLSAMFSAYTLGYGSYDSYDAEVGYRIGNDNIALVPVLGVGYDNQRSFQNMKDGFSASIGAHTQFNIEQHKGVVGYRKRNGIGIIYVGIKVRFIGSKNNKHRFF